MDRKSFLPCFATRLATMLLSAVPASKLSASELSKSAQNSFKELADSHSIIYDKTQNNS